MPTKKNNIKSIEDFINFQSDIEPDSVSESGVIQPYNPEKISIETKVLSMDTCLRRLRQKSIILNPSFQRNEVWDNVRKSRLIESLMLKIPIPMFYVASDEKGVLTVVDGLQRFSAIRDFIIDKTLVLHNLEYWKDYNDKSFDRLPEYIQNRILETEFTFTIINPGTPEEVKLNIFKRINTGGIPLSAQEIRNALYGGKSVIILNELSETEEFKEATGQTIHSLRMEDKELILRYLSFALSDYSLYGKNSMIMGNSVDMTKLSDLTSSGNNVMDMWLSQAMTKLNQSSESSLETIHATFKTAMNRCHKLFGIHTFRKSFGNKTKTPINKCLFEVWGNVLSKLTDSEYHNLYRNRNALLTEYNDLLKAKVFIDSISRYGSDAKSVKYRFETINNIVKKYQ